MRAGGVLVIGLAMIAAGVALMLVAGRLDRGFETNGERIYFTGRNEAGERIAYSGAPFTGMGSGALSCASCHGGGAGGGRHRMHMLVMDAPDIRWSTLAAEAHEEGGHEREYDLATFRLAVGGGRHPDGEPLSDLMPRWQLSEKDLTDLARYLRSLD
jgi:cytochrome c oxidase subunit 2